MSRVETMPAVIGPTPSLFAAFFYVTDDDGRHGHACAHRFDKTINVCSRRLSRICVEMAIVFVVQRRYDHVFQAYV